MRIVQCAPAGPGISVRNRVDVTDPKGDGSIRHSAESQQHETGAADDGLLAAAKNLSQYHREHEKYYSEAPLIDAISLQRAARTLIALAERWASVEPAAQLLVAHLLERLTLTTTARSKPAASC
jgi:hypothetical protein